MSQSAVGKKLEWPHRPSSEPTANANYMGCKNSLSVQFPWPCLVSISCCCADSIRDLKQQDYGQIYAGIFL